MKKLLMFFLVALVLLCSFTALAEEWTCPSCGKVVTGNFCNNCGALRVLNAPTTSDEKGITTTISTSEKYTVLIHVDFEHNLIFSTYDVEFLWDNNLQGTLEHGQDQDFTLTVEPGEYTITFQSTESSSVKGDISLKIDRDTEISYKISCYNNKVTVETLFVDHPIELAKDEVWVDLSASKFEHEHYEDVTAALKTLGFTNIKYDVLYDIVFGWTEDGEVKEVSIDGNNDFRRGNVFKANAEVIITYHKRSEEDPSNITMKESSSNFEGMDYRDVKQIFKDYGFKKIKLKKTTTVSDSYADGEVYEVRIDGDSFSSGAIFKPDDKVEIRYYVTK